MKTPTFREQYDKIVAAYLTNELIPMTSCACFVGNILNNESEWNYYNDPKSEQHIKKQSNNLYTYVEMKDIETVFMVGDCNADSLWFASGYPDYEDRLYRAMERALLALRKLHESKGEVIEDYEFKRRELGIFQMITLGV